MADTVEIEDVRCVFETSEALKIEVDEKEVWIPKSVVDKDSEVQEEGDEGTLVIPENFAVEKGLV